MNNPADYILGTQQSQRQQLSDMMRNMLMAYEMKQKEADDAARLGIEQGQLGVAQQNANTNQGYRQDQSNYYTAMEKRANAQTGAIINPPEKEDPKTRIYDRLIKMGWEPRDARVASNLGTYEDKLSLAKDTAKETAPYKNKGTTKFDPVSAWKLKINNTYETAKKNLDVQKAMAIIRGQQNLFTRADKDQVESDVESQFKPLYDSASTMRDNQLGHLSDISGGVQQGQQPQVPQKTVTEPKAPTGSMDEATALKTYGTRPKFNNNDGLGNFIKDDNGNKIYIK